MVTKGLRGHKANSVFLSLISWRHPEAPRFHQHGEGSLCKGVLSAEDPSFRLNIGSTQDDVDA